MAMVVAAGDGLLWILAIFSAIIGIIGYPTDRAMGYFSCARFFLGCIKRALAFSRYFAA